jgi:hypothetical protein
MRRAQWIVQAVTLILLIAAAPTGASASTLIALDLEELVSRSDSIFSGRVLDSVSFLDAGRIFSLCRVEVEEPIFGAGRGEVVEVITAGGHGEQFSQRVFGAAELEPGERYLLFLEPGIRGPEKHVVGMAQGAYQVALDATTRARMVRPSAEGVRLVRRDPGTRRIVEALPWIREQRSLSGVVEDIRAALGGKR